MPNRILREGIVSSEKVNALSWAGEVFYRRLLSVVDDYGRYSANPKLLRAACYPLKLDTVSDGDVGKWLEEARKAALVNVYQVDRKWFVEVDNFGQQIRAKKSKWPDPPASDSRCKQMISDAPVVEVVSVVGDGDGKGTVGLKPDALLVLQFLNEKTGRDYKPRQSNLKLIEARLRDGASVDDCRAVIAKKCREWAGKPEMDLYLRPKTLFNATNFAQYEGELTT